MPDPADPKDPPRPTLAEDAVVKAVDMIRKAAPRLNRALIKARPQIEAAGKGAVDYARTHERELKQAAGGLARAGLRGPLGLVVSTLLTNASAGSSAQPSTPPNVACSSCGAAVAVSARFCSECGTRLDT